ncbi:hypothetical protein [Kitasatospora sp. NPDC002040]|uniref:hypothetical protein n=1 Tax=Kitasatospora sp. NPDC002040 TaxID=3154661 RepID=UPI0033276D5F
MRVRPAVVAAAALAVLAVPACSSAGHPAGPGASASVPLRAGLLTGSQLPPGFELLSAPVNSTTTGAPHQPASAVPLAEMPCPDIGVESFMTVHAPPLEDVAVAMQQVPADGADDDGWFGQESLDRYAPGRAAEVMAAIRAAAQRCASYPTTLFGGAEVQETVSVLRPQLPADDGLVLRVASAYPGDDVPYVTETGFVREGDVILMVQRTVAQKPSSGVETVLAPALAAYRAAAGA